MMESNLVLKFVHIVILTNFAISQASGSTSKNSECTFYGQCSQICDTSGGCACLEGYTLGSDNKSCSLIDPSWKLLYVGFNGVEYIELDPDTRKARNAEVLKSDENNGMKFSAAGVTFDARNRLVYWANQFVNKEGIFRTFIDEPGTPEVVVQNWGHVHPKGISFDWITGNIYTTDKDRREIIVCRNDSVNVCSVLYREKEADLHPHDVALHPNLGIMFWTSAMGVWRAGMDGHNPVRIVNLPYLPYTLLAVDQGNARIYWAGGTDGSVGQAKIQSATFDGDDRRVIPISSKSPYAKIFLNSVLGVDVLGDGIFWSESISGNLYIADKFTGNNSKVILDTKDNRCRGITLFHVAKQPISRANPCEGKKTLCPHICVLSEVGNSPGYRCLASGNSIQQTGNGIPQTDGADSIEDDNDSTTEQIVVTEEMPEATDDPLESDGATSSSPLPTVTSNMKEEPNDPTVNILLLMIPVILVVVIVFTVLLFCGINRTAKPANDNDVEEEAKVGFLRLGRSNTTCEDVL